MSVSSTIRPNREKAVPGPTARFLSGDRVILLGSDRDVQKFLRF